MKLKSKLIYRSENTCFQTPLPVFFFGMPDGKMLVIFSRFKTENPLNTLQEWIVAQHLDYCFDFVTDTIMTTGIQKVEIGEFMDLADNLAQRIRPLNWFGNFYTNNEALQYFKTNKDFMLGKVKSIEPEVDKTFSLVQI